MPSNWILHTPSTTPSLQTAEDLTTVSPTQTSQFFTLVEAEFLHGATKSGGHLPLELQERASTADAADLALVLRDVVTEGAVMDSGWMSDYWEICERVAGVMGGYPRICLAHWRTVRDAISGREVEEKDALSTKVSSGNDDEKEKSFRFLDLPEDIRRKIYNVLIPPKEPLIVSDWNYTAVPDTMYRRTEYEVPDEHACQRRTTYVVHSLDASTTPHLNLMATNRTVYREMAEMLYRDRTFEFRGTASSTLAFLHDHMKVISQFRKISLKYTTSSRSRKFLGCTKRHCKAPPTLKTNLNIWKKIIDVLMLSASGLEDLEVVVDKGFWERAGWERGAEAVMRDVALCEASAVGRRPVVKNFLGDVCNLSGVNFRLVIEGSGVGQARKWFCKELEKVMCERMMRRPYLAEMKSKCSCRKRLLSEACAWDGGEKRRRI